ncbi:hypothetical protein NA56DRAFT_712868 [Hyaloscypha hepaticicola]|uniref:Uncharacterized protein n=1 Tax=Hyaloscypha hepaticicola TaxID=2082293 RepID=A0A2J6PFA8_9HELO|nr:hypothetical protein NA56DRAFT_712868 [Hyaloscypha hepaticicola]
MVVTYRTYILLIAAAWKEGTSDGKMWRRAQEARELDEGGEPPQWISAPKSTASVPRTAPLVIALGISQHQQLAVARLRAWSLPFLVAMSGLILVTMCDVIDPTMESGRLAEPGKYPASCCYGNGRVQGQLSHQGCQTPLFGFSRGQPRIWARTH